MTPKRSRPFKPSLQTQLRTGGTQKHQNAHTDTFPASVFTHFSDGFTTGAASSSSDDALLSLEEAITAVRDIIDADAKKFRLLDVTELNSEMDGVRKN